MTSLRMVSARLHRARPTHVRAVLLYILGVLLFSRLIPNIYLFNDVGYHARMAQLLATNLYLPVHDPIWRGGIMVNYPALFAGALVVGSTVTGSIWTAIPGVSLAVFGLYPVSVYSFAQRHFTDRAALFAGVFAAVPIFNPDQGPLILGMALLPVALAAYLALLASPSRRTGAAFGATLALVFHSHLLVFTFVTLVTTGYGVIHLIVNRTGDVRGYLRSVLGATGIGLCLFALLTSFWWYQSLRAYGVGLFESPLNSLTHSEVLISQIRLVEFLREYPIIGGGTTALALVAVLWVCGRMASCAWTDRRPAPVALLLLVTYTLAVVLLFPSTTLGISLGPPWRYYVFVLFVSAISLGWLSDSLLARLGADRQRVVAVGLAMLILTAGTGAVTAYTTSTADQEYRIEKSTDLLAAFDWLDSRAPGVVVSHTPHVTWSLYHVGFPTLNGYYGTTHPKPARDRAAATILYGTDPDRTRRVVERYDVRYVLVDTDYHGYVFEIGVKWHDRYRRTASLETLRSLYPVVFERDGIVIFRTSNESRTRTESQ